MSPPAGKVRRWREARRSFLSDVGLTVAVMLLSLLRAVELDDWVFPALLLLFSLCAIWLEERLFTPSAQRIVLGLAVVLQVILYWEHFGPMLALSLGVGSAAYVWREELSTWARGSAARDLVEIPGEIARPAQRGRRAWAGAWETVRTRVHGARPRRR